MRLGLIVFRHMRYGLVVTSLSHALKHGIVDQVFSRTCQVSLSELPNDTVVTLVIDQDVIRQLFGTNVFKLLLLGLFARRLI